MYTLSVKSDFSAAHNLRGYKGRCESLHGHNWKAEAVISAKKLDAQGLVIDFHLIKKELKGILEGLDHKYLNELSYFKKHNPTSENLAKYIYEKLDDRLRLSVQQVRLNGAVGQAGIADSILQEVTVWESDNCSATYSK
jgi:6-pyruvoyltetrahydropterin/6-carboxytetrahydropterin synthase